MLNIRKGLLMVALSICVAVITSGCSMRLGSEIASELADIDIDFDVNVGQIYKEKMTGSIEKEGLSEIEKIVTDISMGDVEISYQDTDTANIQYTYNIAASKDIKLKDILSKIEIRPIYEDNCLTITFVEKESEKDIWKWLAKEYKNYSLGVDMKIVLPKETNNCDIKTAMGDITLNSFIGNIQVDTSMGDVILNEVSGVVNARTSMGDIKAKDVKFSEECELQTSMGDITCSFEDASVQSEISMVTNMGDIKIDAKNLKVERKEKQEEYLTDSLELTIDSVCYVSARTDMGDISCSD